MVADDGGDLFALFVVVYCLRLQADVLLLSPHVVKDDHLHVEAVVSFLYQPLLVLLIDSGLDLLDQLLLDSLDMGFGLEDDVYGLAMLLHFAVDGCLVEIGGNNIVFLLTIVLEEEFFFKFKCVVDRPQGNSKLL